LGVGRMKRAEIWGWRKEFEFISKKLEGPTAPWPSCGSFWVMIKALDFSLNADRRYKSRESNKI
jgi:hypothetical protein